MTCSTPTTTSMTAANEIQAAQPVARSPVLPGPMPASACQFDCWVIGLSSRVPPSPRMLSPRAPDRLIRNR